MALPGCVTAFTAQSHGSSSCLGPSAAQEQRRQLDQATSGASLAGLKAQGRVLTNLQASLEGRLYQELVLRCKDPGGAELPAHKFRAGDSVTVRTERRRAQARRGAGAAGGGAESAAEAAAVEGTVLEARRHHLMVSLPAAAAEALLARPKGGQCGGRCEPPRGPCLLPPPSQEVPSPSATLFCGRCHSAHPLGAGSRCRKQSTHSSAVTGHLDLGSKP